MGSYHTNEYVNECLIRKTIDYYMNTCKIIFMLFFCKNSPKLACHVNIQT